MTKNTRKQEMLSGEIKEKLILVYTKRVSLPPLLQSLKKNIINFMCTAKLIGFENFRL